MDEWARPGEVDVFATGDTEVVAPPDPDTPSAVGRAIRRGGHAVMDFHAAPGYRPGTPIATTSGRRSGSADIVRPVLIDPRRAANLANGCLFATPIVGLDIDVDVDDLHTTDGRNYLIWNGRLSGAQLGQVGVTFHLLASPSMVVTVLELVPRRKVRRRERAFIRAGVAAVDELAERLLRLDAATC